MKRFALVFALVVVAAGVVVSSGAALRFETGACHEGPGSDWTCPAGLVGTPYAAQIAGAGGCGPALPYQYRVLNGSLPAGLTLSSGGLISGTPAGAGTADFWVELSDENPPSQAWCVPETAQRQFHILIQPRLLVTTQSAPPGTVGAAYNLPLQAQMMYGPGQLTPASQPIAWSFTGDLAPGLSLDAGTGVLSGTPTSAGSYLATFKAALPDGRSDTKALQIVVREPIAIAPVQVAAKGSEIGIPISAKFTATGGAGTFTWTLSAGTPPAGVALAADGTLAGKPTASGRFTFTVQAADTEGRTATVSQTLVVAPKLAFKTVTLKAARVGKLYSARLKTLGGVAPVKWKILGGKLPTGIRFQKTLGTFAGTAKKAGRYRVSVEVTDALGVTSKKTFVLVVKG